MLWKKSSKQLKQKLKRHLKWKHGVVFSPSFHLTMWLPFKPWGSLHISFHLTGNSWPFFLFWPSAELEFSVSMQLKCGVAIVRFRSKEVGRWRPHCSAGWLDLWENGKLESSLALKSPCSTLSFQQQQLKEVCHYPPLFSAVVQQILEASETKFRPVIN